MTAVLAGQSDIGFAGPEAAIYVYNEGKEDYIEVFAQMTKRDGSFLVSREQNEDFKWTDLKGSTIIPGRKGGVPYMTFEYVLKQNGIDTKKDVELFKNSTSFLLSINDFAKQCGCGAVVYLYFDKVADLVSFAVEDSRSVLFCPAKELLF